MGRYVSISLDRGLTFHDHRDYDDDEWTDEGSSSCARHLVAACIGIFFARPCTGSDGGATSIEPVALSAWALSFLPGFGVAAVFAT